MESTETAQARSSSASAWAISAVNTRSQQIAARHGRDESTVHNRWARHSSWPQAIGKRGRHLVFDPTAVDSAVAGHIERPVGPPDE
ncbi:hypothetical protein ACFV16_38305 [Streptomyces massasporeus]|uniref:hypothetical protein n=1 Tax=Streptomyces massasporeus TaxID=67324 RepID=UPI0036A623C4